MEDNLGIFIQARMGSTRLPGKIFKDIGGRPALQIMIDNLRSTPYFDRVFILTSGAKRDEAVVEFAASNGVRCFRGSEEDVLDRFFQAAVQYKVQTIVRLTSDCPFLSMSVLEKNIDLYNQTRPDYLSVENYPRGLGDIEIINFASLQKAHRAATETYHREHVTTYLKDHLAEFRLEIEEAAGKYRRPEIRLTLDDSADLDLLRLVYEKLAGRVDLDAIIYLFNREPELMAVNRAVKQKMT